MTRISPAATTVDSVKNVSCFDNIIFIFLPAAYAQYTTEHRHTTLRRELKYINMILLYCLLRIVRGTIVLLQVSCRFG